MKTKICERCEKIIKNPSNAQKYHKKCLSKKAYYVTKWREKNKERHKNWWKKYYKKNKEKLNKQRRELYRKQKEEFVKIPNPTGKQELIYANGFAQDIQKQVPKIMNKICKKLLK